jgi:hypothetical protein
MAALSTTGVAQAQSVTFNTTGNMADHGTYGNALTFGASGSPLQLKVTGWQSSQNSNAITAAYVGAYSPGIGVTGTNDYNGSYGYHQIDNAGSYTDFVLLQFSAPVVLKNLNLNSFDLGSATSKDNDLAFYAADVPEAAWNSKVDLTQYSTVPSLWTTVSGTGKDGVVSTGASIASREWLVGAAFNSGSNDGFKIASITVSPGAVPEPASWAMMILGVGAIGAAARRRKQAVQAATAA